MLKSLSSLTPVPEPQEALSLLVIPNPDVEFLCKTKAPLWRAGGRLTPEWSVKGEVAPRVTTACLLRKHSGRSAGTGP